MSTSPEPRNTVEGMSRSSEEALRTVFMGTAPFAVPTLAVVCEHPELDVVCVVTQPDRPKGRGRKLTESAVKVAAGERALPILQPESAKSPEFIEEVRGVSPDLYVVVAYGQILPKDLLDVPGRGSINLHGSLLPKYRGAAPIEWAIIKGETETGLTTMFMDEGMDTGDIIDQVKVEIEPDDTAGTLGERMSRIGAELMRATLDRIAAGAVERTPQDHSQATKARLIKKEHARIDWRKPAQEIRNLVRGTNPRPIAHAIWRGEQVRFWEVRAEVGEGPEPGLVVEATKDGFSIQTGRGRIGPVRLQPENRAPISSGEFVRGYRVTPGERFE
jgi:methionyl-tRNA formyltransferase